MRTTVNLDETLVARATELTGITQRSRLLDEALRSLIARESGRRLAALGGTEPQLVAPPRRRQEPA